ncbi:hypothetical protein [Leifsonia sp. Leaf264]|uniref:hypothetical protein n=1 Tax=Leifsonia sp. Leaf264 TaxID=1736314 RepID=UPI0012F90C01|nr:hypothetical protein [Leifsonia sp. Leaf264]
MTSYLAINAETFVPVHLIERFNIELVLSDYPSDPEQQYRIMMKIVGTKGSQAIAPRLNLDVAQGALRHLVEAIAASGDGAIIEMIPAMKGELKAA